MTNRPTHYGMSAERRKLPPRTLNRPANFCEECDSGKHRHHIGGVCWSRVAKEPRDYVCQCGDSMPVVLSVARKAAA